MRGTNHCRTGKIWVDGTCLAQSDNDQSQMIVILNLANPGTGLICSCSLNPRQIRDLEPCHAYAKFLTFEITSASFVTLCGTKQNEASAYCHKSQASIAARGQSEFRTTAAVALSAQAVLEFGAWTDFKNYSTALAESSFHIRLPIFVSKAIKF